MRIEVKEKLLYEYSALSYRSSITAIKYRFIYNDVNVNLYFDAYDAENPSLSMVLEYNREYYYTSLNVKDTNLTKEYLEKIPQSILVRILNVHNQLDDFFSEIDKHILLSQFIVINYKKDKVFTNTMKYSRGRHDLPFLRNVRKIRMSDDTVNILSETMGIEKVILLKIQNENMTLVRTDDPDKRKKLTAILQGTAVEI